MCHHRSGPCATWLHRRTDPAQPRLISFGFLPPVRRVPVLLISFSDMRTATLPILLLLAAFAVGPAAFAADGFASDGGVGTPAAVPVLEDGGYRTPADVTDLGGTFLTPAGADAAESFDDRIARVRRGLLKAADDATCAPAKLEMRLQRRLRRIVAQLVGVTSGPAGEVTARLTRAAALMRGYCTTVLTAPGLHADCADLLRRPCPIVAPGR